MKEIRIIIAVFGLSILTASVQENCLNKINLKKLDLRGTNIETVDSGITRRFEEGELLI